MPCAATSMTVHLRDSAYIDEEFAGDAAGIGIKTRVWKASVTDMIRTESCYYTSTSISVIPVLLKFLEQLQK